MHSPPAAVGHCVAIGSWAVRRGLMWSVLAIRRNTPYSSNMNNSLLHIIKRIVTLNISVREFEEQRRLNRAAQPAASRFPDFRISDFPHCIPAIVSISRCAERSFLLINFSGPVLRAVLPNPLIAPAPTSRTWISIPNKLSTNTIIVRVCVYLLLY